MQALRVECRLAGPWVPPPHGLHLDSLLSWVLVDDARRGQAQAQDYGEIISDLPLQQYELAGGAGHLWCASQFLPVGWLGQDRRYLTAKTNVEDVAYWIGKKVVETKGGAIIDTVRGIAKAGQAYFTVEHTRGLRAWCIGDEDGVADLLSRATAVGAKTRIGFGALLPFEGGSLWRITPDPEAELLWRRRASPDKLIEDSYRAMGTWKAPYWQGHFPIWRPMPARLQDEVSASAALAA